ncbi:hypothetical protein GCM10007175_19230 [Pseudarthrobacter scleromae]|uniref:Uncharacterized protein n=1 Tax=Pseudarthrobacter scleromae TaxID=158897 RepID=A0ABQ2CF77_9MICC|nr:hypothetical protein GCM10007175_19230 [Pseudarthrobacter scleromae]
MQHSAVDPFEPQQADEALSAGRQIRTENRTGLGLYVAVGPSWLVTHDYLVIHGWLLESWSPQTSTLRCRYGRVITDCWPLVQGKGQRRNVPVTAQVVHLPRTGGSTS